MPTEDSVAGLTLRSDPSAVGLCTLKLTCVHAIAQLAPLNMTCAKCLLQMLEPKSQLCNSFTVAMIIYD